MAVVRKVQSKIPVTKAPVAGKKPEVHAGKREERRSVEEPVETNEKGEVVKKRSTTKKVCFFHKTNCEPHYWDATSLRKFVSDRGRINPRARTGTCSKHQRSVAREIKRARHLSLLPFAPQL